MPFSKTLIFTCAALGAVVLTTTNCELKRKKYENPISKDTLQPDKVLFDRAMGDIEHGRFEIARLTLNTLINTYDSSEFLAKSKLAIADSWYREGGAHGLAQAEAEYKDFELFYPNMEESAEAQWRVCQIHYKQMDKVDRDNSQAIRAEDECRQMITAYPNSRYTAKATQMLRNVQEVLAEKEYLAGDFYHKKGAFPAAANRFEYVSEQYPLFHGADEALWEAADAYKQMGDRFDEQDAAALTKLVRDYPLSDHVDEAKERLEAMKRPIPAADPAAYERMKYEADATQKPGMLKTAMGMLGRGPETYKAAHTGAPAMTAVRPPTPVSVPAVAPTGTGEGTGTGAPAGTTDVTAQQVTNTNLLDTQKDARETSSTGANAAAKTGAAGTAADGSPIVPQQPLATNHPYVETKKQKKARMKRMADAKKAQDSAAPKTPAQPTVTPSSVSGQPATPTNQPQ